MDSWFQNALYVSFWPSYLGSVVVALALVPIGAVVPMAVVSDFYVQVFAFAVAVLLAALAGYLCEKYLPRPAAHWVWTAGLAWLALGGLALARFWSNERWSPDSHRGFWHYLFEELFRKCGSTDCLYALFFTYPAACSIIFSIGATVALRRMRPTDGPT
jgi:hypothetical protein